MAQSVKTLTNKLSQIQSKAQEAVTGMQQKTASSSAAAKSGSTTTPTVTKTPKVTQTAKAVPSLKPEITPVSISTTPTPTVNARDLLWSKTTPTLRKAAPDLLSKSVEKKDVENTTIPLNIVRTAINMWWKVADTVAESLYNQWLDWINEKMWKLKETRENVTDVVWRTAIDMFKWVGQDISNQWTSWEWIWMVRDAVANLAEWLPRGITRVEYWLAELADWWIDAKWLDTLKWNIKSNLDYWENTRVYKRVKETDSFSDFLKNPLMYAGWTFSEMLPMFINAWVAVPTTFSQVYWDTYRDYAEDESLQDLTDNQIRLMSVGVAWINTIIELWSDLVQGIMPWTKTAAKWAEKEVRRVLSKPFSNIIKKIVKWWASEWIEEVLQSEIQDQVAWFAGSDRDLPTWWSRLTTFWISSIIWGILQWGNVAIDINRHKELKMAFDEWSEAVDKIAPWVSKSDKEKLFSAIVAAEIEDANMSEDLVNKYEAQTTELYNRIDELNKELETTTDENRKQEINRQIEDANQKIKDIDEIINKGNAIMEEVNTKLQELSQQEEAEELYEARKEIQAPEEWGENLSEQTMRDVESVSLPSTPEQYQSFYRAITQPQNTFLKEKSYEELATMKADLWAKREDAVSNADYKSGDYLRSIIRLINKEMAEKKWEYQAWEIKKLTFKNAKDYVKKMIDIDKRNWVWSKKTDRDLREWYMQDFLRTNLEWDLAAHLPWLKWVNLKQIEGDLTDAKLRDIAEMLSLVSTTFWVDFNKVISDAELSVNIADDIKNFLYNTDALGQMSWKANKEQIKNLIERTWRQINPVASDIIKTWVTVTLNRWPERAGSIMSHELWHLIDFALSTEAWLPLKIDSKNRMTYTSIIEWDMDWKTFKVWTYNPTYYNDWSEILARYAEEYFAYKNSPDVFKELSNRPWYWSEEEFQKLLPKFESFIKERVWAKLLDEQNQFYNQVVRKINENLFQTTLMEFSEREDMEKSEVEYKLAQLETEYAWIMQTIKWMKWDLKDEMEAYVQLSNLQSNYEMAKAKWEEYLNMLKTTPEQQDTTDTITTAVVPEPPQNPETINNWLPQLWWSNIENGLGKIIQWESWNEDFMKSYMTETDRVKMNNRKKRFVWFFKELHQTRKDILTPAISRIYNISPRVAWRLITMETQKDINIHRYRKQAEWFVKTLWGLKWKQALEVKAALLDYWALASEQWDDIEQYKKEEVAKLKEVLLRNWFKEKDINDMFGVLNDIWQQYKDAWLSIVLTDMYFPRVVKDYEWLIDYMNRVSDKDIKLNKTSLMIRIREIQADDKLNDAEKEARIRRAISMEFRQPWTTSQHWKERKMWKLSDWWPWIYAYYESPIESIDHYITTMVNAIERQLFLGWIKEDANLDADIINQGTEESVSQIIWKLVEDWQVSEDDVEELQKSIMSVLNKKPSPKSVTAIKDVTYIATITNFLSAINQLDDLWMVILKDKSWLKHIVKTIFGKANIKYDDLGLEDAYEMFREEWGVTNWLFKKSLFNTFDRLGKTSFINTAWESMMRQSKNSKTRHYLYARLQAMYWTESANRMMEKIDSWNYNWDDGQVDIEILRDLLYQLWSTQPLYTSAMPTTYLNHPWARLAYALSSFTLKRIDWLVQWTKEVYQRNWGWAKWATAAWAWVMSVSMFLAMFWAAIGDAWDLLKGDKEETFLWKWINEWIDEALKSGWSDALDSWLKIWDLSEYDMKTYKQQWLWWVFASKIKPFIFDLGKDVQQAIAKHDMDEITDLAKYVPIFWKLVYYWLWDDLESSTKSEKKSGWDWSESIDWDWWEVDNWNWETQEEWDWS